MTRHVSPPPPPAPPPGPPMGVRYDGGLVADPQGDPLFVDLVYGDSFTGAFLRASIAVGIVAGVSASAVPIVVLAAAVLVAIWKLGRP